MEDPIEALQDSPLRKLSAELRVIIFKLVVTCDEGIHLTVRNPWAPGTQDLTIRAHRSPVSRLPLFNAQRERESTHRLAITQVCKVIRRETGCSFFTENCFHIHADYISDDVLSRWLNRTAGARLVSKMTIAVVSRNKYPLAIVRVAKEAEVLQRHLHRLSPRVPVSAAFGGSYGAGTVPHTDAGQEQQLLKVLKIMCAPMLFHMEDEQTDNDVFTQTLQKVESAFTALKASTTLSLASMSFLCGELYHFRKFMANLKRGLHKVFAEEEE